MGYSDGDEGDNIDNGDDSNEDKHIRKTAMPTVMTMMIYSDDKLIAKLKQRRW